MKVTFGFNINVFNNKCLNYLLETRIKSIDNFIKCPSFDSSFEESSHLSIKLTPSCKMEFLNRELAPALITTEPKQRAIPIILDGKFFEILSTEPNGTVKAKCLACTNGKKSNKSAVVSGRFQPSSNFTTHLKVKLIIMSRFSLYNPPYII